MLYQIFFLCCLLQVSPPTNQPHPPLKKKTNFNSIQTLKFLRILPFSYSTKESYSFATFCSFLYGKFTLSLSVTLHSFLLFLLLLLSVCLFMRVFLFSCVVKCYWYHFILLTSCNVCIISAVIELWRFCWDIFWREWLCNC